jgi:uncharacterized protein YdeI (YjbR/CyaY-like superfamily)
MAQDFPQIEVKSRAELRSWLMRHHDQSTSIWLISHKKSSPYYLPYDAIVEEALCFGGIDSQPRALDEERSMLRLSPRKAKSGWSKVNKGRVEKLIAAGLMTPAGLARIEEAKRSGTWDILEEAHSGAIPADLAAAFAAYPAAAENFAGFPLSTRKAILEWIALAKRAETRAARIAETARLAASNERANQWKKS